MKMSRGKLIIFEGPDGVGKSTLVSACAKAAEAKGDPVLSMSFPGKEVGSLGKAVYELHHDLKKFGLTSIHPLSLQLLHVAAHVDVIESKIKPALAAGKWIVLDRFWWSTWVYGLTHGIAAPALQHLIELERDVWNSYLPDLAVLLWRDAPFKSQPEDNIWNELAKRYSELAELEAAKYPVLRLKNEGLSADDAVATILKRLGTP
jgi:dTMP kinase